MYDLKLQSNLLFLLFGGVLISSCGLHVYYSIKGKKPLFITIETESYVLWFAWLTWNYANMTMYIVTDFSLQGTTTTLGHENDFEVDKWRKYF